MTLEKLEQLESRAQDGTGYSALSGDEAAELCAEIRRLRSALEYTEANIGVIQDGSSTQRWLKKVRLALGIQP